MPENAPEGSIIAPLMIADKIYADHIASNAITSDKILANAITSDKIAANAITANKIGTNQIITNSANIANGVIQSAHIKDAAIETAKIKDGAITNAKIANLAVDNSKIANLDAAKITTGVIKGYTNTTTFDLDNDKIQVGNNVKMGKGVLPDTSDGLYIENGKFMVKNPDGTVVIDGTKNMLKVLITGTVSIGPKNNVAINFTPLSYQPIFLLFNRDTDIYQAEQPYITSSSYYYYYYDQFQNTGSYSGTKAWTNNNYIRIINANSWSGTFRYYIFEEIAF